MRDLIKIILGLALIVGLLAIGPLCVIWSANTLFPALAIPYGIDTWAAVIILGAFVRANVKVKRTD